MVISCVRSRGTGMRQRQEHRMSGSEISLKVKTNNVSIAAVMNEIGGLEGWRLDENANKRPQITKMVYLSTLI